MTSTRGEAYDAPGGLTLALPVPQAFEGLWWEVTQLLVGSPTLVEGTSVPST